MRVDSEEVKLAYLEGRVVTKGKRRGKIGYMGVVSRVYTKKGKRFYEIDVNCIGGVPAPLAMRPSVVSRFREFFGRAK